MPQVQLATRIDRRVKKAIEKYCRSRGLKISAFLEEALLDKLEEVEDAAEISKLRREPTTPFEDIVKDLKLDGLL